MKVDNLKHPLILLAIVAMFLGDFKIKIRYLTPKKNLRKFVKEYCFSKCSSQNGENWSPRNK
jgi:hypothetical protein